MSVAQARAAAIAAARARRPARFERSISLLDGSAYDGPKPFDRKHYHNWYQQHVYRPRVRLQRDGGDE